MFDLNSFNNVTSGAAKGPRVWSYGSSTDTLADIGASGYFDVVTERIHLNDLLYAQGSDGAQLVKFSSAQDVTPVTTDVYVPSAGGGGGGSISTVSVPMTAAEFKNLSAVPLLLVAAPGAGKFLNCITLNIELLYGTTQYADGSAVFSTYGNGDVMTAAASLNALSAAIFNYVTFDTIITGPTYAETTEYYVDASKKIDLGLYLRVDSTDFTTGDSDFVVHVSYETITTGV